MSREYKNTSISKLFKELGEVDSARASKFEKLFKSYGIRTANELINAPRSLWKRMIKDERREYLPGTALMETMEFIAGILYPKIVFTGLPATSDLAYVVFKKQCMNVGIDGEECVEIFEQKYDGHPEEYEKIYRGFQIPKAPEAPSTITKLMNYLDQKENWEQEFEEYRPRRQERLRKNYSGKRSKRRYKKSLKKVVERKENVIFENHILDKVKMENEFE